MELLSLSKQVEDNQSVVVQDKVFHGETDKEHGGLLYELSLSLSAVLEIQPEHSPTIFSFAERKKVLDAIIDISEEKARNL